MQFRLVLVLSLVSATAAAGEIAVTNVKDLPTDLKARGAKVERAVTFSDKNGTNYVAFSSTDSEKPDSGMGPERKRVLFIDHWAVAKGKKARTLLPARDFVETCPLDLVAKFVDGAFGVTDLDADGLAEVTYGYQLACRGDVSSATYKLLVVENGKKYIFRGTSRLPVDDAPPGGEFTPEPAEAKWPRAFYKHAAALWKATADDVEMHR
ncbi:MAG: hypothetical protein HOV81_20800 [Kofleriaceae bacterium]|nr:hypothetical protein [Kofleriaceae bacterium]